MALPNVAGSFPRDRRRSALLADAARLELMDLSSLKSLLRTPAPEPLNLEVRAKRALEQAVVLRELARRTGELSWLTQARAAAARAAHDAGSETRLFAAARLQHAQAALAGSELFADPAGESEAAGALAEAEAALNCAPGRLNGPGLVRARLSARTALTSGDREAVMAAVVRFQDAAAALEGRVRATGAGEADWAAAQCERAELLIAFGQLRKEAGLLDLAARDLAAVATRLDSLRLPISRMRVDTLRGAAQRALGELLGDPGLMNDAAGAYAAAWDTIPEHHSPLDRARAAHGLGLTLQSLGEASGETRAFGSAMVAFNQALCESAGAAGPFRSILAYDRAACLTRRAERTGDLTALDEAEVIFRADLASRAAGKDPVAWAVVQVALARIYEVRADLEGRRGKALPEAAFALSEALDVFRERGLRSLSEIALSALERLKTRR